MSAAAEKPAPEREREHGRFLLALLEADLKQRRQLLARITGQPPEPELPRTPIERLLGAHEAPDTPN